MSSVFYGKCSFPSVIIWNVPWSKWKCIQLGGLGFQQIDTNGCKGPCRNYGWCLQIHTPPLVFNVIVVFLNASNHKKKMCQKGRKARSQTYAWLSVSRKQMSKWDCLHVHTHADTCAQIQFQVQTWWHGGTSSQIQHMSKFGVITTAEWYNIVSFILMQEEKPSDSKL